MDEGGQGYQPSENGHHRRGRRAREIVRGWAAHEMGEAPGQEPQSVHLPTVARQVAGRLLEGEDRALLEDFLYAGAYGLVYEVAQRKAAEGRRDAIVKMILAGEMLVSPDELSQNVERLGGAFSRWRENVAEGQVLLEEMKHHQLKDAAMRRFRRGAHDVRTAWFNNTLAVPLAPTPDLRVKDRYSGSDLLAALGESAREVGGLSLDEIRRAIEHED